MKWLIAAALAFSLPLRADELPPGYLIPATELETVYALQRLGYPVREIREEIELDVLEATPTGRDTVSPKLKKTTVAAKPGMFLVRTERLSFLSEPRALATGEFPFNTPGAYASGSEKPFSIRLLLPNQPIFVGTPRPLPEHRLTNQPFTAEQLKLGRKGLAGEPMDDVTWLPDGEHWLQVKEGKLWKTVARTGRAVELFVDPKKLLRSFAGLDGVDEKVLSGQLEHPDYTFDPQYQRILFGHGKGQYLAHLDGRRGIYLGTGEFRYPTFSANGKWLAFVRAGNLWVIETVTAKQTQLTTDGGRDEVLNGRSDWVYEEEIFHRNGQAFWWSPDSKQIAFLRFDDSRVPKFELTHTDQERNYTTTISYPKAGNKNPLVKIGVVDVTVEKPEVKFLRLDDYQPEDTIISRVGWVPGKKPQPFAYVQNRTQTWLDMVKWPTTEDKPVKMFREETGAWVEDLGEPKWLKDGSALLLSERSGHRHIYRLTLDHGLDRDEPRLTPVTRGNYDVRSIIGDHIDDTQVAFHRTTLNGTGIGFDIRKIDGSDTEGDHQAKMGTRSVTFAPKCDYWLTQYTYDDQPKTTEVTLKERSRTLDSNPCHERERFHFGKYERTKITTRDGFEMEAAITYPPDFHELNKYPVWMLTYGGPDAPSIKDGWAGGRLFEQILAAQGIVVVRVDPQSASGKGMVNAKVCYKQLGVKELQDLEDAVDWLAKKPWADTNRVGLSGHSFGGFLTAFTLTHSKKFSAGIAGAPVTDWRLYDSIYSERYMGLPSENKEGYDKTSVVKAAKDLHGELLIVHGLVDDNVHAQNSLQLISALQKAGKDFEVMVYPDDRHGIQGVHYPQTMLKFITRTMGVKK